MQSFKLAGTIIPLVTPFASDEALDGGALRRLVDDLLGQGASALMPTALTGEGPLLTMDETLAVWDIALEQVGGRLPVVPAVISTTTRRAVQLARAAQARGATALMVAPVLPELYAGRAHDEVVAFYADVAAAMTLPIILFNYPSLTGVDLVPALVERLAEIEAVQYIKESTGDTRRVHGLQRRLGERVQVICGAPNVALESLALGCQAWITGIMNVVPRSSRQLMEAVLELHDLDLARRIYYAQILPVVDLLAVNYNPTGTIKAGTRARGVEVGVPRRPGHDVSADDRARLAELVAGITRAEVQIDAEMAVRRAAGGGPTPSSIRPVQQGGE
jgi:4-hydroxy-tetrahydrodipicolinate synthase